MLFLAWRPFVDPFRGAWDYWYLLLLPLAILIALIYKAIRLDDLKQLFAQTSRAALKLLAIFLACAAILWAIVLILER